MEPSYNDSIPCSNCSTYCEDIDSVRYCKQHQIKMGLHTGQHFCLEHNIFHCNKHWRECCKQFGMSAMTRRRTTPLQITKRAEEIQAELESELHKYEIWIDQIKHNRFICSECRQSCCICDMRNFREFERHRKQKQKKIDEMIKARDLSFMKSNS